MSCRSRYVLFAIITLFLNVSPAMSAQTGDSVTYNFTGTYLLTTPCTISNDEVLNIPFGNVGISKVDGSNYIQSIPYLVNCKGATDDSPVRLMVTGTAATYDTAALVTSADGLGIRIQADGKPMKINEALTTTLGALQAVALTAVPVKDPDKELSEQSFSATATLTAEYE